MNEPWKLISKNKSPLSIEAQQRLDTILYVTLESLRISSLLLQPIMPTTTEKILDRLGVPINERNSDYFKFGRIPCLLGDNSKSFIAFSIPNWTP